ncbi:zinc ribbon domain-containing protein [Nocardioides sp. GY 10113]|uniref:zinc ribbon domain-containing protein n=1 Tax=Nocardioides sp. GY 10113 TaxID=2569761 RepID=UPI0010A8DEA7|nr:zinc ribbon domain-containing protein [Nocardioides sp. GY 10113]TIC88209.1 zinc ribbon domain-containing protein [Nocardioides sp. GY 10113]
MTTNEPDEVSPAVRRTGRVLLAVTLAVTLYCCYRAYQAQSADLWDGGDAMFWWVAGAMLSFFLTFLAFAAAFGTAPRYRVKVDLAPSAQATLGASRDARDPRAASGAAGPYCRECGVRQNVEARFCDACGTPLG